MIDRFEHVHFTRNAHEPLSLDDSGAGVHNRRPVIIRFLNCDPRAENTLTIRLTSQAVFVK